MCIELRGSTEDQGERGMLTTVQFYRLQTIILILEKMVFYGAVELCQSCRKHAICSTRYIASLQ